MPFLAVAVPHVPEEHKDQFLAAFPKIAAEIKVLPMVLGVSAGPIVAENGAAASGFKFIQTIAFATAEDAKAFKNSEWAQNATKEYEARASGPPLHALFEVADFPKDQAPKAFTQFSRVTVSDEVKGQEVRKTWEELMAILGKQSWGGHSIGDGDNIGMGLVGWDSLEEAGAAMSKPDAKAAWEKYHTLGSCKDVMVKMQVY